MEQNKDWNRKEEGLGKKIGDKLERVGEKISERAPGIGKKVRDLGDKIEHSGDSEIPARH